MGKELAESTGAAARKNCTATAENLSRQCWTTHSDQTAGKDLDHKIRFRLSCQEERPHSPQRDRSRRKGRSAEALLSTGAAAVDAKANFQSQFQRNLSKQSEVCIDTSRTVRGLPALKIPGCQQAARLRICFGFGNRFFRVS